MLYKYTNSKFVDSVLDKGTLRIGTLEYYKDIETHGRARGDDREGHVVTKRILNNSTTNTDDNFVKFASKAGFKIGRNTRLVNCIGINNLTSQNCYIYCMSRRLSTFVAQSFECDTAIELFDIIKFTDNATEALVKLGLIENSYIVSPIFYSYKPETDHVTDVIPSLIKRNRYAYQHEVRIIWPVLNPVKVEKVDIEIGSMKSYAKRVNISNDNLSNHHVSIFKNISIKNSTIRLINPSFHSCKFDQCQFIIDSLLDCRFEGAEFNDCSFELSSSVDEGIGTMLKISEIPMFADLFKVRLSEIERILKHRRACAGHFRRL